MSWAAVAVRGVQHCSVENSALIFANKAFEYVPTWLICIA